MGLLSRKNTQTTVSVRMSLQEELLYYAQVLGRSPSTLVNDILEESFSVVQAGDSGRPAAVLNAIRVALGKDAHRRLSDEYHRVLFGTQPPETERASSYAQANAAQAVPVLKEAKQKQKSFAQARVALFGCFKGVITEEIDALYESPLMTDAAAEIYDPARVGAKNFFEVMQHTTKLYNAVYQLFLKDHLAREVVREIPPHFLPPAEVPGK